MNERKRIYKFITITPNGEGQHEVVNNRSGSSLGFIEWDGGWKQWTFWPDSDTEWSAGCLTDIINYIGTLEKP